MKHYQHCWKSVTAFLYLTMLPPHQRVHGVAPGGLLYSTPVTAVIGGVLHLREYFRWGCVAVGVGGVPRLAFQATFCDIHVALIVAPISTHTGTWN